MSPLVWKVTSFALAATILLILGGVAGGGVAANYCRTQLDAAQDELSNATAARNNLEALTGEQGLALGRLVQAGRDREQLAVVALQRAKDEARLDYEAANRLQLERFGGDPARAAASIIDQELAL